MRGAALAAVLALAVACGGAASRLADGSPSARPTASGASGSPAASAVGTIVPVGTFSSSTSATPAVVTTPSPAPGGLAQAQLKYRVIDTFGRPLFCDPDFFPVARGDEQDVAHIRLPEIQQDAPTFVAILIHTGIGPSPTYTPAQELAIYRDWKALNALPLGPAFIGFRFSGRFPAPGGGVELVEGTIDNAGAITGVGRTPSSPPNCPICLARGTLIDTPGAERTVEELRVGDVVWTQDLSGARIAAPLVAAGSTPVPPTHEVVRLVLSDGRAVLVSPGHPTADGRRVGELRAGDRYDGAAVASAERVRYSGGATFDILPAGVTGTYWANGVLLGSTLR